MSSPKIPLYRAFTDEEEVRRVSAVLRRGSNWAIGPEVEQFEKEVASYVGRKHAVSFNSGTSALHASMIARALDVVFRWSGFYSLLAYLIGTAVSLQYSVLWAMWTRRDFKLLGHEWHFSHKHKEEAEK